VVRRHDDSVVAAMTATPLVAENRMRVNPLLDRIPLLSCNIAQSDEQHHAIRDRDPCP
jgi:hypothetical protein